MKEHFCWRARGALLPLLLLLLLPALACSALQGTDTDESGGDGQPVVVVATTTAVAATPVGPKGTAAGEQEVASEAVAAAGEQSAASAPTPTRLPEDFVAPLDVEEALVTNLYQRVSPAVVYIAAEVIQMDFFFGPVPREGTGSGFILDQEGHILTNYHVIENADSIAVTLSDETQAPAKVIGVDPPNDLALLKIDVAPELLTPVELGSSADLTVGQRAIAIGNPFGLDRTLTVGVISALGRPLQTQDQNVIFNVVQTDAAINPGNSGGPLLDSRGRVIAVNTAIREGAEGIGFAVPIDTVKRVLPAMKEKGYYPHPWLGFLGYTITPELAQALELPVDQGLLVAQLYRNSPAQEGGLRGAQQEIIVGNRRMLVGGDIVVAIDGQPVAEWDDLYAYLELETQVGDEVVLQLLRDGEEMQLPLQVAEQP